MEQKKFVSWRRVSTKTQGNSGLGLEAQKTTIEYFIKMNNGTIIADFEEVYTGKDLHGCTELKKAIELAKKEKAILIIAKTNRFRNVQEALEVLDDVGSDSLMFCDMPTNVDRFTLTLFFAIAEREALIISIQTKQALAEKKKAGVVLGRNNENYTIDAKKQAEGRKQAGISNNARIINSPEFQSFCRILKRVYPFLADKCTNEPLFMLGWKDCLKEIIKNTNSTTLLSILQQMRDAQLDNPTLFKKYDLEDTRITNLIRSKVYSAFQSIEKYNNFMEKNLKDLGIGDKVYCTGDSGFCDSDTMTIVGIGHNKIYNNKIHKRVIYLEEDEHGVDEENSVFDGITGEALTEPTAYYILPIKG